MKIIQTCMVVALTLIGGQLAQANTVQENTIIVVGANPDRVSALGEIVSCGCIEKWYFSADVRSGFSWR